MLSSYGKGEWSMILLIGGMIIATLLFFKMWIAAAVMILVVIALLAFFRDPRRDSPVQRNIMVSPADGKVSSIHEVEHYEPFGEPATCVRIFLSVLDVHVNRSPCHGQVVSIDSKPGKFMNALNPQSAEVNESVTMLMVHPNRRYPVCAVRQVAGAIARRIVCGAELNQILQRGERFGMIKFGSTTELYLPASSNPQVQVKLGEYVWGGETVLAQIAPVHDPEVLDRVAGEDEVQVARPDPDAPPFGESQDETADQPQGIATPQDGPVTETPDAAAESRHVNADGDDDDEIVAELDEDETPPTNKPSS